MQHLNAHIIDALHAYGLQTENQGARVTEKPGVWGWGGGRPRDARAQNKQPVFGKTNNSKQFIFIKSSITSPSPREGQVSTQQSHANITDAVHAYWLQTDGYSLGLTETPGVGWEGTETEGSTSPK